MFQSRTNQISILFLAFLLFIANLSFAGGLADYPNTTPSRPLVMPEGMWEVSIAGGYVSDRLWEPAKAAPTDGHFPESWESRGVENDKFRLDGLNLRYGILPWLELNLFGIKAGLIDDDMSKLSLSLRILSLGSSSNDGNSATLKTAIDYKRIFSDSFALTFSLIDYYNYKSSANSNDDDVNEVGLALLANFALTEKLSADIYFERSFIEGTESATANSFGAGFIYNVAQQIDIGIGARVNDLDSGNEQPVDYLKEFKEIYHLRFAYRF